MADLDSEIINLDSKTTLVANDITNILDSAASNVDKKTTLANIKTFTDSDVVKSVNGETPTAGAVTLDLSGYAAKNNVLELDNTSAFTPTENYHPATKKYVDDNAGGGGATLTWNLETLTGNATLTVGSSSTYNKFYTTTNYTITLSESGASTGDMFVIAMDANTTSRSLTISNKGSSTIMTMYKGSIETFIYTAAGNWENVKSLGGQTGYSVSNGYQAIVTDNSNIVFGTSASSTGVNAVAIGASSSSSTTLGVAVGGSSSNAQIHGTALGSYADNLWVGGVVHAIETATTPDSLYGKVSWRGTTSNDTETEIFLRGQANQRFHLSTNNDMMIAFEGIWSSAWFASGYYKAVSFKGVIKRASGTVSLLDTVIQTLIEESAGMEEVAMVIEADDTNKALVLKITGLSGTTLFHAAYVNFITLINR